MQAARDLNLVEMFGQLAAGLALFLFGLKLLTDGLKASLARACRRCLPK